jgi:hypothetical protein
VTSRFDVKEHGIQNTIRNDLAGKCFCFRANVGTGFTASKPDTFRVPAPMVVSVKPGDVVLYRARPFDTGLPAGFHDLFGWDEVTITPDMVGQKFARFVSFEVKTDTGRESGKQTAFRHALNRSGGASGVVRSSADAFGVLAASQAGKQL